MYVKLIYLQSQLSEKESHLQAAQQKVSSLEKQKHQLTEDNDDLTEQLHVAKSLADAAEKKIKQLDKSVTEWKSRLGSIAF